jgi:dolichol-phosphate mannosyltransferase
MVIAVITPTYNEQDNIETITNEILAQQANLAPNDELHVVISDSHSPDQTGQIAMRMQSQNPRVHYVDVQTRGIGIGIVEGFRYAVDKLNADMLVSMDADLSHPPSKIPVMAEKIREGYDLIIGSRYAKGGSNNYGPYRKMQSWLGNQILRLFMGVYDVQEFLTSYRALTSDLFKKANLDNVPWRATTFVFQPAFIYELFQHNPKYIEVPFDFINRRAGRSKMNTFRYMRDVLQFAVKARVKKSKQFAKFLVVGGTGFLINAIGLVILDKVFHIDEAIAASIGAEIAIISNFFFNNFWTFRHNRVTRKTVIPKFLQFNLSSAGAILIQFTTITLGKAYITPILPFNDFWKQEASYAYFLVAVGIGLIYNYIMYSRVIWKKKPATAQVS